MNGLRWQRLPLYIVAAPFVAFVWVFERLAEATNDLLDRLA